MPDGNILFHVSLDLSSFVSAEGHLASAAEVGIFPVDGAPLGRAGGQIGKSPDQQEPPGNLGLEANRSEMV